MKLDAEIRRAVDDAPGSTAPGGPLKKGEGGPVPPPSPLNGVRGETQSQRVDSAESLLADLRSRFATMAGATNEIAFLRSTRPDLPQAYIWHEPSTKPPPAHVLLRGNPKRPGDAVEPAIPTVLVSAQPKFSDPSERASRRRLGLANWIVSPENPLTARVLVNRVWQQHFGIGLVRTPSDFGLMGEPPTHPELLDWLACWFVHDAKWSLKKLHRLMLTSNAWRMSRAAPEGPRAGSSGGATGESNEPVRVRPSAAAPGDPENLLLSHLPYRRLEVEVIRDSILAVSGQLNPVLFGPAVFPKIPDAAIEANTDKHSIWKPSSEAEANRRTIYVFVKRGLVVPMLEVLDLCDTVNSTARRQVTTVAPQALTLFNGDFVNEQAEYFATRLRREAGGEPDLQINLAFRLALGRSPTDTERRNLLAFLETEAARLLAGASKDLPLDTREAQRRALVQVCRVVLNLNEFVYPD